MEEVQSPKTTAHIPKSINSKHRKSEDFDLEKAAAIWVGRVRAQKNRRKTVTCSPNEQQKLGSQSL